MNTYNTFFFEKIILELLSNTHRSRFSAGITDLWKGDAKVLCNFHCLSIVLDPCHEKTCHQRVATI